MIDRSNRAFLAILGLALIGFGVVLLCARSGALSVDAPSEIYNNARNAIVDNQTVSLSVTMASCGIVFGLALWTLRLQSGLHRPRKVRPLAKASKQGVTRVDPDVIEQALAYELRNQTDIEAARVAVTRAGLNPRFKASVEVMPTIDLSSVAESLRAACEMARKNLELESLDGDLRVGLASRDVPRVD